MRWGQNNTSKLSRSPALSARSSRGFVRVLAAAAGAASTAFAVPSAALAKVPGASTPTQVASPPAASVTDADKRVVADLLFKRLLLKPDDLDAGFRYAELETELGDYEAAIGALERILHYDPNLSRAKLQLGTLYFHLRSYEMARNCFDAVLNAPDVPPDIRAEVQTMSPRSIRPSRSILDRCQVVRFFRGAFVRAYRVTADAHALGRIFVHPLCGTGRDRLALITRMDTQWRVAGTLGAAFYRNIGFTLPVQYLRTYLSGSNYSLQDFIVAAGPTFPL
jgi:tetratricopeptide (TPR) repeat protein